MNEDMLRLAGVINEESPYITTGRREAVLSFAKTKLRVMLEIVEENKYQLQPESLLELTTKAIKELLAEIEKALM